MEEFVIIGMEPTNAIYHVNLTFPALRDGGGFLLRSSPLGLLEILVVLTDIYHPLSGRFLRLWCNAE